ncbi:MAG: 50S ribosomal protein L11 methyltransferase [Gammaproteobacteria bacterium]|nr:50S ribosomal protein L11 methyltransferase [Gammaproteobacteria bacterium]MDH5803232.1 50S ribosomal protein L11 methyltransferase [Gammaproteobacteria bacterium]
MPAWFQIVIGTDSSQAEPLADILESLGAASVTFMDAADQPLFEPPLGTTPLWHNTKLIGLFKGDTDMSAIISALETALHPKLLPPWRVEDLEDKNWAAEWMKNFQPIRCGERLWICPSWHQPPEPNAVNVLLDPGMAFGTGTHPTTALCLKWLDQHLRSQEQLIDFGCGSGILAVAALKLGAAKAWAVDHDPQALQATRINAEKNQVAERLQITQNPSECPAVDTIVANILANPLLELAPTLANLVKPQGRIVLSGILKNQAESVSNHYQAWFHMADIQIQDDWTLVHGIRRSV